MPNPIWEKMKPAVTQIVLFAVIGLGAWFGVRPFLATIQARMDDIQKLSVMREYREKQLERLPDLEAQHALIGEEQGRLNIILTKDRLVEFIEALEQLALETDVTIEIESRDNAFLESKVTSAEKPGVATKRTAAPGDEKGESADEPVKKSSAGAKETGIVSELPLKKFLKLTMTVSGEYGNIIRYLQRLETLPYALDVVGMHIRQQPETGDRVAPVNGAPNPFGVTSESEASVQSPRTNVLEAVFETAVYTKD